MNPFETGEDAAPFVARGGGVGGSRAADSSAPPLIRTPAPFPKDSSFSRWMGTPSPGQSPSKPLSPESRTLYGTESRTENRTEPCSNASAKAPPSSSAQEDAEARWAAAERERMRRSLRLYDDGATTASPCDDPDECGPEASAEASTWAPKSLTGSSFSQATKPEMGPSASSQSRDLDFLDSLGNWSASSATPAQQKGPMGPATGKGGVSEQAVVADPFQDFMSEPVTTAPSQAWSAKHGGASGASQWQQGQVVDLLSDSGGGFSANESTVGYSSSADSLDKSMASLSTHVGSAGREPNGNGQLGEKGSCGTLCSPEDGENGRETTAGPTLPTASKGRENNVGRNAGGTPGVPVLSDPFEELLFGSARKEPSVAGASNARSTRSGANRGPEPGVGAEADELLPGATFIPRGSAQSAATSSNDYDRWAEVERARLAMSMPRGTEFDDGAHAEGGGEDAEQLGADKGGGGEGEAGEQLSEGERRWAEAERERMRRSMGHRGGEDYAGDGDQDAGVEEVSMRGLVTGQNAKSEPAQGASGRDAPIARGTVHRLNGGQKPTDAGSECDLDGFSTLSKSTTAPSRKLPSEALPPTANLALNPTPSFNLPRSPGVPVARVLRRVSSEERLSLEGSYGSPKLSARLDRPKAEPDVRYLPPKRFPVHPDRPAFVELRPHPREEGQEHDGGVRLLAAAGPVVVCALDDGLRVWNIERCLNRPPGAGAGSAQAGPTPGDPAGQARGKPSGNTAPGLSRTDKTGAGQERTDSRATAHARLGGAGTWGTASHVSVPLLGGTRITSLCMDGQLGLLYSGHKDGCIRAWGIRMLGPGERDPHGAGIEVVPLVEWLAHSCAVVALVISPCGELWSAVEKGAIKAWPWSALLTEFTRTVPFAFHPLISSTSAPDPRPRTREGWGFGIQKPHVS